MRPASAWQRPPRLGAMTLLLALLGGSLAGCGSHTSLHPIVHGTTAKQVETELVKSMASWQSTSAQVTDVVRLKGKPARTLQVALITQASPNRYALTVNQAGKKTVTIRDNGRSTVSYTASSRHYQVLSSLPHTASSLRLMGISLPSLVESSTLMGMRELSATQVELKMRTSLPNGVVARTDFWYNLRKNIPIAFSAKWDRGYFKQTVSKFQVNPDIGNSAFAFHPATGVTPQVVLSQTLADLELAKAAVKFPIVLPPSQANVSLTNVSVGSRGGQPVVMLTYTAPNGSYLLVTELSANTKKKLPSGLSFGLEPVGALSVNEAPMPLSGQFAGFSVGSTEIWLEGLASSVDNLLTVWGNNVSTTGPGT